MRSYHKGLIGGFALGATVTASALVGYAYGRDAASIPTAATQGDRAEESAEGSGEPAAAADAKAAACRVLLGQGRLTAGYQCMSNRVMVGAQGGYLYCADLTVTCP